MLSGFHFLAKIYLSFIHFLHHARLYTVGSKKNLLESYVSGNGKQYWGDVGDSWYTQA